MTNPDLKLLFIPTDPPRSTFISSHRQSQTFCPLHFLHQAELHSTPLHSSPPPLPATAESQIPLYSMPSYTCVVSLSRVASTAASERRGRRRRSNQPAPWSRPVPSLTPPSPSARRPEAAPPSHLRGLAAVDARHTIQQNRWKMLNICKHVQSVVVDGTGPPRGS